MTFNEDAQLDTSQVTGGGRGGKIATAGGGGIGLLILVLLFNIFIGGKSGIPNLPLDPTDVLSGGQGGASEPVDVDHCKTGADANKHDDCLVIGTVNSVQNYWDSALPEVARTNYVAAQTVIFSGAVQSACGQASSAMGPFYCPTDQRVYIDPSFYDELESRFGADGGSLAKMYVVAHEYGHHVENILGFLQHAQRDRSTGPTSGGVRVELMADCLAGVWIKHASATKDANGNTLIEPVTEKQLLSAVSAANAVGDDHIQQSSGGSVNPEQWTHGSSEMRERWLLNGYKAGTADVCNTFEADEL